ncbi:MAG: hypothetical protein WCL53_06255 [Chloroflexota bacterium]
MNDRTKRANCGYFCPAVADGFGVDFFGFFAFLLFGLLSPTTDLLNRYIDTTEHATTC